MSLLRYGRAPDGAVILVRIRDVRAFGFVRGRPGGMLRGPGTRSVWLALRAELPRIRSRMHGPRSKTVAKEVVMKAHGNAALAAALTLAALASMAGCSESAKNSTAQVTSKTATSASSAAGAASSAMSAGASLVNQLGGMSTVTQLADAFGVNIAGNPQLSKLFDAAAITQVKDGLVNEVAKASGMTAPKGPVSLLSALSGKGLDATGVDALTSALSSAGDTIHLGSTQKAAVMALVSPILNQALGK